MNGQRLIDNCHAIAKQQYPDDHAGAQKHEIELLRTKVLELAKKLEQHVPMAEGYANPGFLPSNLTGGDK
jgi:hypothetical protein